MIRAVLRRHAPLIAITLCFVATRLVYRRGLGVTFDTLPLEYFIQYIDVWFVEHDFWRSQLYLHQQAPIQNLLVGGAWKLLGPGVGFALLDALHVTCGWVFALVVYAIQRRLGVGRLGATIASILFVSSPFFVLVEAWMFYHLPVAALLAGSVLALLRYYRTGAPRAALFFFSLLALISLWRNIFGTTWMVATVLVLVLRPPVTPLGARHRRIILKAAAIPILIVTLVGMKPRLLFGHSSGSAMLWGNISYRLYNALPRREKKKLKAEGTVSSFVDLEPFSPVTSMGKLRIEHQPTGVPLLDMATSPDGRVNTFTLENLLIHEKYAEPDGRYLLRTYPQYFARAVLRDLSVWYMSPITKDLVMHRTANRRRILAVEGAVGWLLGEDKKSQRYLAYLIAFPLTLVYGMWRVLRARAALASERSSVAAISFLVMNILYVSLSTTIISYADYSRYRFDVDAFYLILLVLLLSDATGLAVRVARRARARWAR